MARRLDRSAEEQAVARRSLRSEGCCSSQGRAEGGNRGVEVRSARLDLRRAQIVQAVL